MLPTLETRPLVHSPKRRHILVERQKAGMSSTVAERIRSSNLWTVAGVLPRADFTLSLIWWTVLILRGLLPAVFTIVMGMLVGAVQHRTSLMVPLTLFGSAFVLLQLLPPIHRAVGANLGSRT